MTLYLYGMVGALCRSAGFGDGGRTIHRTEARLEDIAQQVAVLACVPFSRVRVESRRSGEQGSTAVEEGVAKQFDLPDHTTDFGPRPYLSRRTAEAHLFPDRWLREEEDEVPLPRVHHTTGRRELLRLAERWDRINRLLVVRAADADARDCPEVFGVLKKQGDDGAKVIRHIFHRKRRNLRESLLHGATLGMPHASRGALVPLPLERSKEAVASVDDLSNYFHWFSTSEDKACRMRLAVATAEWRFAISPPANASQTTCR